MKLAIFGGGRTGQALAAEMPGVPVVRRGADLACDAALVCWPAQAIKDFARYHPQGARAYTVAFCNGCWARDDGMVEHGCCYVRAVKAGDRAAPGYKGWRVADKGVAAAMRKAGAGVVCTRGDAWPYVWGKGLYVMPLAIACAETGLTAYEAAQTALHAEWFELVIDRAIETACEPLPDAQIKRARYLLERLPRGWRPSPTPEEVAYFKERLCAG